MKCEVCGKTIDRDDSVSFFYAPVGHGVTGCRECCEKSKNIDLEPTANKKTPGKEISTGKKALVYILAFVVFVIIDISVQAIFDRMVGMLEVAIIMFIAARLVIRYLNKKESEKSTDDDSEIVSESESRAIENSESTENGSSGKCKKCGAEITHNGEFCTYCGRALYR